MTLTASSPERFDTLRAENPDLAMNLYAMEPGGSVTLEIITPDTKTYTFTAPTAAAALALAFPEPTRPTIETDIFA